MAWDAINTVPAMHGKSLALRELFAKVANAALAKGQTEEEAIFSGISAVKIQENKNKPAKATTPKVPAHLAAVRQLSADAFSLAKAAEPLRADPITIKAAEFDAQGHLIILMSDGSRIVTKGKAIENIEQKIGISVNPVFDYVQMNTTANLTAEDYVTGMLTWNEAEDCLDIIQADNTRLQVGLENYFQVYNHTGSTLLNGTVVRFSGVNAEETPEVLPMIADGSVEPLYIVGVLTNDIPPNSSGRATVLGKVRTLNTTGSDVGETWLQGDLLWAHPTLAGKLTRVRPSAPHVGISIAAVLRVSATEGVLLVRPTIFPRLFYGNFSSSVSQHATTINTPTAVQFESTEFSSGVHIGNSSRFVTEHSGLYAFDFRLQVTSTNSSAKNIYIWGRKNGTDIPKSATKVTLAGNGSQLAPSWSFTEPMVSSDYFELMFAVDDLAVSIDSPAPTAFCPAAPAATMRVTQINL